MTQATETSPIRLDWALAERVVNSLITGASAGVVLGYGSQRPMLSAVTGALLNAALAVASRRNATPGPHPVASF